MSEAPRAHVSTGPGSAAFGTQPKPFGNYILLSPMARGGVGQVWLAKHGAIAGIEKYSVLKMLRPELTQNVETVKRFIDEARVVVQLNHANICHVFDVGRVNDEYYLAMEYVSGRDLSKIQETARKRGMQLPVPVVVQIMTDMLEGLDYAHRRKDPMTGESLHLVHRDISPQNVMVSFEGEVKLIDFGLATSKMKGARTEPNIVLGKMAYMSPEQAAGEGIDHRTDIFATAVLGYELLVGERYYEGMTSEEIWNVVGRGEFCPRKWQTLDKDLALILVTGLDPDRHRRYKTAGEFRQRLSEYLHGRYPGTGMQSLRDLVDDLFALEMEKERATLARFGQINTSDFATEIERSGSNSISLLRTTSPPPVTLDGPKQAVAPPPLRALPPLKPLPPPPVLITPIAGAPLAPRAKPAYLEEETLRIPRPPEETEVIQRAPSSSPSSASSSAAARASAEGATRVVSLSAVARGAKRRGPSPVLMGAVGLGALVVAAAIAYVVTAQLPPPVAAPVGVAVVVASAPAPIAPAPITPAPVAPSLVAPSPVAPSLVAPAPVVVEPAAPAPAVAKPAPAQPPRKKKRPAKPAPAPTTQKKPAPPKVDGSTVFDPFAN